MGHTRSLVKQCMGLRLRNLSMIRYIEKAFLNFWNQYKLQSIFLREAAISRASYMFV